MGGSGIDERWLEYRDPSLGITLRYPATTSGGSNVDRVSEEVTGGYRVHLTSADGAAYVEVVRFTGLAPADEYSRHRTYLSQRFGPEGVTEPQAVDFQGRPGLRYAFRGGELERSVVLLPAGDDLIRFIIDPRSPLNHDILDAVTLSPNG